jgi:hypothetical protein
LISGPELIRKVLSTTNKFDWNKATPPLVGKIFDLPPAVVKIAMKDDSGVGVKPYAGSNVPPQYRIHCQNHVFNDDAFSKASTESIVSRFTKSLQDACTNLHIEDDWSELPDLYTFIRDLMFSTSIGTIFGPKMLELNPDLASDFWLFNENVGFLAMGIPNWFKPQGAQYRAKCLAAVTRWRRHAENELNAKHEDPAWNSTWGLGVLERKYEDLDPNDVMSSEGAKASADLGFLWA